MRIIDSFTDSPFEVMIIEPKTEDEDAGLVCSFEYFYFFLFYLSICLSVYISINIYLYKSIHININIYTRFVTAIF